MFLLTTTDTSMSWFSYMSTISSVSLFDSVASLSSFFLAILVILLLIGCVAILRNASALAAYSPIYIYSSQPNEWCLVIRSGVLINCGVGLRGWALWTDQVVKFPSFLHKVKFSAEQVSKEMQGLRVSGFLVWNIYREGDGPFRAYKNLKGLPENNFKEADESIANMAESICRHRVANSTIAQVLTNREVIRDSVRKEMLEVVKGWGVWLETVEITDVTILSKSLFENMQAEFRQKSLLEAEEIKANTQSQIERTRIEIEKTIQKQRDDAETQGRIYNAQLQLVMAQEEAKLLEEKMRIKEKSIEEDTKLKISEIKNNHSVDMERVYNQQHLDQLAIQNQLDAILLKKNVILKENENSKIVHDYNQMIEREINENHTIYLKSKLKLKNEYYNLEILNTVNEMYNKVNDIKMVQMTGDSTPENMLMKLCLLFKDGTAKEGSLCN